MIQPAGAGRHWDAATTDHVGRTTLHSAQISKETRTADTATMCQTQKALQTEFETRDLSIEGR